MRYELYVGFRALFNGAGRDAFVARFLAKHVGGEERQKVVPEKSRKVSNLVSQVSNVVRRRMVIFDLTRIQKYAANEKREKRKEKREKRKEGGSQTMVVVELRSNWQKWKKDNNNTTRRYHPSFINLFASLAFRSTTIDAIFIHNSLENRYCYGRCMLPATSYLK